MNVVESKGLSKQFRNVGAVNELSFTLMGKKITGLVGPNGAGKTTLIRIINQITYPDSGRVIFDNAPLNQKHIQSIGYLPEERGLYKSMKVGEQALYLAQLKGMSKAQAKEKLHYWFDRLDIGHWWDKKIQELSKGMAQKIQFVVTVLHEPELLIFDEPFSGFDPINTNLIKKEILRLRDEGAIIIFSTHNMGSVEELCDHIALINKSWKIEDGPTNEIRQKYKSNVFEIKYTGSFETMNKTLGTHFNILEHEEHQNENRIRVQYLNGGTNNEIIQTILPAAEILAFKEIIPSMNDVFIKAVQESNKTKNHE